MIDHETAERNAAIQADCIQDKRFLWITLIQGGSGRPKTRIPLLGHLQPSLQWLVIDPPPRDVPQAIASLAVGRRLVP